MTDPTPPFVRGLPSGADADCDGPLALSPEAEQQVRERLDDIERARGLSVATADRVVVWR